MRQRGRRLALVLTSLLAAEQCVAKAAAKGSRAKKSGKKKLRYYEAGPPSLRPLCLNGTRPLPSERQDYDYKYINVAFFDTRAHPDTNAMMASAVQIKRASGSENVRFHVLLRVNIKVPGMTLTMLDFPPVAKCLYAGLARLSHGPGPAYLYKPLLHYLMPTVRRLILLDTDIVVLQPISRLWRHFERFGPAVLGVANEQTNMYQKSSGWRLVGKNGGVQLLDLHRMRESASYARSLDEYASGQTKEWIGFLGDQTLYTQIAGGRWGALVYTLPCEWNRQISMQFGFANRTVHACAARCAILHANYKPLKCLMTTMQANPTCSTWRGFYDRPFSQVRAQSGNPKRICGGTLGAHWARFSQAMKTFFSDCCISLGGLVSGR